MRQRRLWELIEAARREKPAREVPMTISAFTLPTALCAGPVLGTVPAYAQDPAGGLLGTLTFVVIYVSATSGN